MPQQAPIRWSLNSWAAQANHGHPNASYVVTVASQTENPNVLQGTSEELRLV